MTKSAKRIVLLLLISASFINVRAQLLNNTRWKSFDQQNIFDMFWNFSNDTLATSPDNILWTDVSVYSEAGNIVTFRDIDDLYCNSNDIGVYQFSIQLDILYLTVLNEPCATRANYDTTHYFVDFPIGVNDLERYRNVSIYPVPFSQELNVKTEMGSFDFSLLDVTGRKVIEKSFHGHIHFDTRELEPGMYLYELRITGRIVKSGTVMKY